MTESQDEKFPAARTSKEHYLATLDQLCESYPTVAKRREMLLLVPMLIDKLEQGMIMDAQIQTKGILAAMIDIASDTVALVYNQGWALGFEGDGGELCILIDSITTIRPYKTGLEIDMESGELVRLRFLGRVE